MKTWNRLIQGSVIAGFLVLSSGCVIAPDHERDRGEHEHDRNARDHDRDARDRDRHCDEHDERCRDR